MDERGDKNAKRRNYNEPGKAGFLPGNPGRPLGVKNKFTEIKEEVADLWKQGKMQEKILALMDSDPKEAREILKVIASMMPKEDTVDLTQSEPLTIRIENESRDDQKP